jgi:hypothetical protein
VIKSKHPRLAPATLIGLCRTVDHMQCRHMGGILVQPWETREKVTPLAQLYPRVPGYPRTAYLEPLQIFKFFVFFWMCACFCIRYRYIVCLSNVNLKILLLFYSSSAAAQLLNSWFNPHRFWTVRHISVRSIGPTYCTNQPSIRQWEIAGILPYSAQCRLRSTAGHQSLSGCSI